LPRGTFRANRAFLRRAVHYMAAEAGIRQFLDIGSGLPTQGNVHEIAQAVAPEARVVHVDNGPVAERLAELAPDGIDVFFDNVAGEQFEAALSLAAPNARFALCGALSGRNPTLDLEPTVLRDVTLRGFTTPYEPESSAAWNEHYSRWLREGRFVFPHTVVAGGIAEVPRALVAQLRGAYKGTALLKLS
jgi:NADPH-dependent curcumin reductase CurA